MNFHPRTIIKRQALADCIAKFTYASTVEVAGTADGGKAAKAMEARDKEDSTPTQDKRQYWSLYINGTSYENGSRAGMMLIRPEGQKIHCALHFGFQASNNKAEY